MLVVLTRSASSVNVDCYRPWKVCESEGSYWNEEEGRARGGYRRGSPPIMGVRGFHPTKFWTFYVQNGAFGGKISQ